MTKYVAWTYMDLYSLHASALSMVAAYLVISHTGKKNQTRITKVGGEKASNKFK